MFPPTRFSLIALILSVFLAGSTAVVACPVGDFDGNCNCYAGSFDRHSYLDEAL